MLRHVSVCSHVEIWCLYVELWSPHVETCGDEESTCGDMCRCGDMWRGGVHMEICGAVMSVGCGV